MSAAELKNDLHRLIVETDDINILQKIRSIFNSFIKGEEEKDWWDIISDQEKASIKKGLEQLEKGERLPHNEIRKEINELLKK
jgi:predicted transcriptional regulator